MDTRTSARSAASRSDSVREECSALASGAHAVGPLGSVLFVVSTADVDEGKGDLFVALGMARQLRELGWGVAFLPESEWTAPASTRVDVAVVMVEGFVPGHLDPATAVVAWVRNWTEAWAALPYLDQFDDVWCSSETSRAALEAAGAVVTGVVPIAVDDELFGSDLVHPAAGVVTTANFWGVERGVLRALEQISEHHPVDWYGANGEHLRVGGRVVHHDSVSFFDLPAVYAGAVVVVDDLIPAALSYHNLNSRLFEALAVGTLVVTNARGGLEDLGLGKVPTYSDAEGLVQLVGELLASPESTRELGRELSEVVRARHTYAIRAAEAAPRLTAAIARRGRRSETDVSDLTWVAALTARLRRAETEGNGHLVTVRRLEAELAAAREELTALGTAAAAFREDNAKLAGEVSQLRELADRTADELSAVTSRRAYRVLDGLSRVRAPRS